MLDFYLFMEYIITCAKEQHKTKVKKHRNAIVA